LLLFWATFTAVFVLEKIKVSLLHGHNLRLIPFIFSSLKQQQCKIVGQNLPTAQTPPHTVNRLR